MTWRIQYFRRGSDWPVTRLFHGDEAENRARRAADKLRGEFVGLTLCKRADDAWSEVTL